MNLYSTNTTALNLLPGNLAKTALRSQRKLEGISLLRKLVLWVGPLMIAALLSFISVLSRSFVRNVPARTTGFAGLVVNVLPHVFLMKNIFALTFPNLPTSATAISNVPGVLWKNAFTKPITPERIRAAQKRIPVRFRSFRSGTQTTRRCGVSASHKGTVPSPYLCTPYR